MLSGNKGRPARCAALLGVVMGEHGPLVGQSVDVRRFVAHDPVIVGTDIVGPDIIPPDHQYVRPFFSSFSKSFDTT